MEENEKELTSDRLNKQITEMIKKRDEAIRKEMEEERRHHARGNNRKEKELEGEGRKNYPPPP